MKGLDLMVYGLSKSTNLLRETDTQRSSELEALQGWGESSREAEVRVKDGAAAKREVSPREACCGSGSWGGVPCWGPHPQGQDRGW